MQSKILFEVAPTMKLSCVYCTKTTKVPLPSLKKQSNLSYDEDIPDSGKVSTNYIYRNPTDPDEVSLVVALVVALVVNFLLINF